MEIKDSVAKNVKLTETEKDILDEAYSVIDRLDYLLLDYLILNGKKCTLQKILKKSYHF